MVYADTDFFLALMKQTERLKERAKKIRSDYSGDIQTSIVTFIELMLIAKRFNLDAIKLTSSVMKICNYDGQIPLKAALYIEEGISVFDAFHAAHCGGEIISSDHIFDELGIKRIKIESSKI